jgi:hypothetical protein
MLYAAENYQNLYKVIQDGYCYAAEKFTIDNCINNIIKVYDTVFPEINT